MHLRFRSKLSYEVHPKVASITYFLLSIRCRCRFRFRVAMLCRLSAAFTVLFMYRCDLTCSISFHSFSWIIFHIFLSHKITLNLLCTRENRFHSIVDANDQVQSNCIGLRCGNNKLSVKMIISQNVHFTLSISHKFFFILSLLSIISFGNFVFDSNFNSTN